MADQNKTKASNVQKKTSKEQEKETEIKQIIELIEQLKNESKREKALEELPRKRESFTDLALYLWYSTGTVAILLQEVIKSYQIISHPQRLTTGKSTNICNVLALFQCIASHPDTKIPFLQAQILIFLYPFLNTLNKAKPYEYMRLTALGVVGSLIKVDSPEVIDYLLITEIIPLCLRIIERGSELSKTVASFIINKIISDENGLKYICEKAERIDIINTVLEYALKNKPTNRLNKNIIRIYYKLAENEEGRNILKLKLPAEIKSRDFFNNLDNSSKRLLLNLFKLLKDDKGIIRINKKENIGMNDINMNKNYSAVGNVGLKVDMNNNLDMNNAMIMKNQNKMILNQLNLQQNQGYIVQNNVKFNAYNEQHYLNKGMFMRNVNNNNGYNYMNIFHNQK